jgi:hypothetical protein
VHEDLRGQLIGEVLFEQGSERLDGEVDQPGQVGGLKVANVHVSMSFW